MELIENLSKNLKALRGAQSQTEFAKEIGITKSTLQAIETQRSAARLDTLEVICDSLGLSVEAPLSKEPLSGHAGLLTRLLERLDWFVSLPENSQKELVAWLQETVALLSGLVGEDE